MNNQTQSNVVFLSSGRAIRPRRVAPAIESVVEDAAAVVRSAIAWVLVLLWPPVRFIVCTVLVLMEPFVRIILVPLAFASFAVTLVFGFAIGVPNFPKWGMLVFSMVSLWLYWAYLGLIGSLTRWR